MAIALCTLAAVAALGVLLIVLGVVTQRRAIVRKDGDLNYDSGISAAEFPPSGDSPFRTHAHPYNIWWNSQPLEQYEILSHDGLRLVGHLLRAAGETRRVAFVIHGHRCVSGEMGFISKMYHERGYHVFAPDQRAHGKSEGRYIGMGYYERLDMIRWLDLVNQIFDDECEIILHGISMGAASVMKTAGERSMADSVVCAIEDCGYTNAYDSILFHMHRDMKWVPLKRAIVSIASVVNKLLAGYYFREADCTAALQRAAIPMLFIHGTADPVVPFSMLKDLYDSHGGEKEMLVMEGAPHGTCYFWDSEVYIRKTMRFADKYFLFPVAGRQITGAG